MNRRDPIDAKDVLEILESEFEKCYLDTCEGYQFRLLKRKPFNAPASDPLLTPLFEGRAGITTAVFEHVLQTSVDARQAAGRITNYFRHGERLDVDPTQQSLEARIRSEAEKIASQMIEERFAALGGQLTKTVVDAVRVENSKATAKAPVTTSSERLDVCRERATILKSEGVAVNDPADPERPNGGWMNHVNALWKKREERMREPAAT